MLMIEIDDAHGNALSGESSVPDPAPPR